MNLSCQVCDGSEAMKLLIILSIATVAIASPADEYAKFLDSVIETLDGLVNRTGNISPEDTDRLKCLYGINAVVSHITESWAMSMIDSGSKLQSGILMGNLIDLGQYEECIQVQVSPQDFGKSGGPGFTGQHCLLQLQLKVPNDTITLNDVPRSLRELFGQDSIPLTMSQCFPSLCKPWVLEEAINQVLSVPDNALWLLGLNYSVTVSIGNKHCSYKDMESLDELDWTVAGIIIFIVVIATIATIMDYCYINIQSRRRQKTMTEEFVVAFSLYSNGKKLLDTEMCSDAMTSLNGLKFFSMAWVVLAHRYRYLISEPLANLLDFPEELKKYSKCLLLSGPLAVDSFFLISGLLNMYTFCIMREKNKRYSLLDVLNSYVHRFFRLTPAYLMMMGFTATWLFRMREGPLWYKFAGTAREYCREDLWSNIIYLNNYLEPEKYCMMQSWYLAADMQMFWLSPLIIYPLWRWPIFGMIELFVLLLGSIISPTLVSYYYNIKTPIPMTNDHVQSMKEMTELYLPTHTKTVSYVLGIGAGYLFYKIKKGKIRFSPCLLVRSIGWVVAGTLMIYAIFGGHSLYQLDSTYEPLYSAFFIGFQRFFWSLGLVWIIFTCVLGYGGPINSILSWKVFIPLGRLTYCVYLCHIAVILTNIGAVKVPFIYSDFDQIERYFGDLVMSLFAALVLSLLLEAPMMKVEKMIFGGGLKKSGNGETKTTSDNQEDNHNHQS